MKHDVEITRTLFIPEFDKIRPWAILYLLSQGREGDANWAWVMRVHVKEFHYSFADHFFISGHCSVVVFWTGLLCGEEQCRTCKEGLQPRCFEPPTDTSQWAINQWRRERFAKELGGNHQGRPGSMGHCWWYGTSRWTGWEFSCGTAAFPIGPEFQRDV